MRTTPIVISILTGTMLLLAACGGGSTNDGPPGTKGTPPGAPAAETKATAGMITAADITLGDIDAKMVDAGKGIYELKCQACHSLGANRVVGPGWKGLMDRRAPEWIMNMMLFPDAMLDSDPEAQRQLEECLVRMPNQSLSKNDGRNVLEFIRTL